MMRTFMVLCLLVFLASVSAAKEKMGVRLQQVLERTSPDATVMLWVFFADKGEYESLAASVPATLVSERSLRRRAKVREAHALVDYADLPVSRRYLEALSPHVRRIRQQSKWFNAVSVVATKQQIDAIAVLPFVSSLELVARFPKDRMMEDVGEVASVPPREPLSPQASRVLDYGPSFDQLNQIAVPAVHNAGYDGSGVYVGVFDNGFRLLTHEVFDSMTIHATYDFVDHKVSVVPNNPNPAFGSHGVNTLSVIGGFKSGQLIGPAYKASYILARTENDSSETPIEEDNWVAAIEWADSIGVDVTSTSLGYLTYDAPYTSWTWQDMNGNTTLITRAADAAVARGIVVVNSAGNNGFNAAHNTLNAPADGDSVLSVGAVDAGGIRSSFSSVGPTTSTPSRIKPDVMARGSSVYVASATNPTGYGTSNGTSFSCPLVAGVAALLLQARPHATPLQIIDALRSTASRATTPDNLYGWGIVNAFAALNSIPVSIQLSYLHATHSGACIDIRWGTISEINNFGFEVQRSRDRINIFTVPNSFVPGHGTTTIPQHYQFTDCPAPSGTLFYRLRQIDLDGTVHLTEWVRVEAVSPVGEELPTVFALHQNYPNPVVVSATQASMRTSTTVVFELPFAGDAMLVVSDVLGREVLRVVDRRLTAGRHLVDIEIARFAAGVYFYTLKAAGRTATRTMLIMK